MAAALFVVGLWYARNSVVSAFSPSLRLQHYRAIASRFQPTALLQQSTRFGASSVHPEIRDLMKTHDPILLYVSKLLPPQKAVDAAALYAWCRRLDEVTDGSDTNLSQVRIDLENWVARFEDITRASQQKQPPHELDPMDAALAECLQRHPALGQQPFVDMMTGMKADATSSRRIATLSELEDYGYQVAGTVGLMLLPLLMDSDSPQLERAKEPAIALGTAIQLINVLRDAAPDATQLGRIYLPQELLREANVTDAEILHLQASDQYCRVVQTVAGRAEELLQQAALGKSCLPGSSPLFVQIIIELYRGYLEEFARRDYNNLSTIEGERVRISTIRKLRATLKAIGVVMLDGN